MALMLGSFTLTAQTTPSRNCGAMEHLEHLQQLDPKMEDRMQKIEKITNEYLASPSTKVVDGIITIPVVFHVVYRTAAENLSDAVLQEQLDVMNEDFRRLNSDADNTWSQAADTEIEFCLASVDPNGNATSGITRKSTSTNGFGTNDAVKFNSSGGKDAWPRDSYLNFWVCNIGGGILGYAQFPGGSAATDGVVNDYRYTGITGASAPFNGGRTATHEVGHWLNLRHIWGDGGCGVDDFVADTPESDASNGGCNTSHVSCGSTDMVQNYMDYSDDACMNLFTQGQKDRMRALFEPGGARASLLNSAACGPPADPTCDDGIQNGNETGVDCGGPDCANACPTCDDGMQNGDETGVDCGGSSCNACPCTGSDVTVTINLDNYPEETSWSITDSSGNTVASGGTYGNQADGSTVTETLCLNDGCYDFTINDAYGDGICCGYGNGSYSVTGVAGSLASGGEFGTSETTNFCLSGAPTPTCDDGEQNGDETGIDCGGSSCDACPTCDDGEQNGDETGVDCGGSSCDACPTCDDGEQNGDETGIDCGGSCAPCDTGGGDCTDVLINSNDFNSWGIWNDGGSDCRRNRRDAPYANTGDFCVRLRDNSGAASSMTTDDLNLSSFEDITVDFNFISVSMEAGEDIWLQISNDGGSTYTTSATWASGSEYSNGVREFESVNIPGPFAANSRLRIRCDASGNGDRIYIDDVVITGCTVDAFISPITNDEVAQPSEAARQPQAEIAEGISKLNLFPNPATDRLTVSYEISTATTVQIVVTDLTGKVVSLQESDVEAGRQTAKLQLNNMNSGIYLLQVISDDARMIKKFVVVK